MKVSINSNSQAVNVRTKSQYSYSTVVHNFDIKELVINNVDFVTEFSHALSKAYLGNGDVHVYVYNLHGLTVSYETTDSDEFSEAFADEIAEGINKVLKKFLA